MVLKWISQLALKGWGMPNLQAEFDFSDSEEKAMKFGKIVVGIAGVLSAVIAFAGGNPEHVKFPNGYEKSFTHYVTMNRAASPAVAKMYANAAALESYRKGQPAASGSIVIMEVHKPKKDAAGNVVVGSDGVNETDGLAAIAVMERRDNWPAGYTSGDRVGTWGFAIYNPDGTPKENDLACVTCHSPLEKQDFLFSHQKLVDFVNR